MKSKESHVLLPLSGAVVFLLIWQAIAVTMDGSSRLIATPVSAFERLFSLVASGNLNVDITATVWRWVAGFSMAIIIGAPAGLLLGSRKALQSASSFVVDFLRSMPVTALFPVFLVFFGVGNAAMIAMSFSATVFIIVVHAIYGMQSAAATRTNMARSFGATPSQIFWRISAIEALTHIVVGVRTALSLSLVVVLVAEMFIGTSHGLGQRLYLSYQLQIISDLYAIILVVGTIGYAANRLFIRLERHLLFWAYT